MTPRPAHACKALWTLPMGEGHLCDVCLRQRVEERWRQYIDELTSDVSGTE